MARRHASLTFFSLCASIALLALSGCSTNFTPGPISDSSEASQTPIGQIRGVVHGGQSPVGTSKIFLFETGISGYGSASKSLITSGYAGCITNGQSDAGATFAGLTSSNGASGEVCYVLTDNNGNFALSGDYTCDSGRQVYMVGMNGNSGFGGQNQYIVQMAGLGTCPSTSPENLAAQDPYVVLNEVTTVAFAYSMAGFGSDAFDIGTDGTPAGVVAIQNAMANAMNIVNIAYGQSPTKTVTSGSGGTIPQAKIYSLANIIANCVNMKGSFGGNGNRNNCYYLFSYLGSTPSGNGNNASTTFDEAQAIFYIAHNPTVNVSSIYGLSTSNEIFTPALGSAPTDWTLPITFSGAVSSQPGNIAFDSFGNAWVSDRGNNAVVKITPTGVVTKLTNLNSNGGANGTIYQLAVDPGNVVWALDSTKNQIYRLLTSGAIAGTNGVINTGSLNSPSAIAFDANGNAFVTNTGSSTISRYTNSGSAISGTVTYNTIGTPQAMVVDNNANVWTPGYGVNCGCIGELQSGNTAETIWVNAPIFLNGYVEDSTAIAIDKTGKPWVANINGKLLDIETITFIDNFVYDNNQYTGGGLNTPVSLAIDGAGNFWMANSKADTVTGMNSSGTALATNGFPTGAATSSFAYGAAPDLSGNLWTINSDGSVTELLGQAAPTATPVYPGQFATEP